MGTWDTGVFDNDGAMDYLGELIDNLNARVVAFCGSDEETDLSDGEDEVIPSVAIITLLVEHCNAAPPKSEAISEWKDKYLALYDRQIDDFGPDPEYKTGRRKTIEETFERLLTQSNNFWSDGS